MTFTRQFFDLAARNKTAHDVQVACNKPTHYHKFKTHATRFLRKTNKGRVYCGDQVAVTEPQMAHVVEQCVIPRIMEGKRLSREIGAPIAIENEGQWLRFKPTSMTVLQYHVGLQPCRYTHQSECEQQLMTEMLPKMTLQTDASEAKNDNVFWYHINKGLSDLPGLKDHPAFQDGWLLDKFMSIIYLLPLYMKCTNVDEFLHTTSVGYKMLVGRHMVTDLLKKLFETDTLQSDVGSWLKEARRAYEKGKEIYNGPMAEKMSKLLSYLLVHGVLERCQVPLTEAQFKRLSDKRFLKEYGSVNDMWLCVFDTALFVCERAFEAYSTGDVMAFVQTSSAYEEWFKETDRVLSLSPFLGNLEAHGTTYFSFVSDVGSLIEKGDAYVTYLKGATSMDATHMRSKLSSLKLLKATTMTRTAAQESRKAPLGVLIAGGSSVAKSQFSEMLFNYYGSLFKLDTKSNMRYTRCPADEYWSNFMSSMWCIQMDDIAFLLPSKSSEVDPTLKELLNVVNNVPYTPPQASLEDKGKTPVMARLCIATTNAEDLNAHEYFHCPLAVRRRLPYVINVRPKKEYLHPNGQFIDPSKLPEVQGEYPDFWHIEVKKIVPVKDGTRDRAHLETVAVFDNTADFLQHFGRFALEHQKNQDRSDICAKQMTSVAVCNLCLRPSYACECALQVEEPSTMISWYVWFLEKYIQYKWTNRFLLKLAEYRVCRWGLQHYVVPHLKQQVQMRFIQQIREVLTPQRIKIGLALVSGITVFVVLMSLTFRVTPLRLQERPEVLDSEESKEKKDDEEILDEKIKAAFEKNKKENVWYQSTVELTRFDLPLATSSMAGMSSSQARDYVNKNVLRMRYTSSTGQTKSTCMLAVKGSFVICNNHALDDSEWWDAEVITSTTAAGLTPNFKFRLTQADVSRVPEHDLAAFTIAALPPRKDITKLWSVCNFPFSKGAIITRKADGTTGLKEVHNAQTRMDFPVSELNIEMPVTVGVVDIETEAGECGSPWLAMTPKGPVIIGFHMMGHGNRAGCSRIDIDVIKRVMDQQRTIDVTVAPRLALQGDVVLQPIHHKSPFRYQINGVVQHYGSFPGHRAHPRSKVCPTPISKEMVEFTGMPIAHGPPAMTGYEPWEKNIRKMVDPPYKFSQTVVNECVEAFTRDIVMDLTGRQKSSLLKLTWKAAVNGIAGVKYIDRINTTSSMGHPWCKTKKHFLKPAPTDDQPDAVTFGDDVWERVFAIEATYQSGSRAYPVFTGHLKDEPTALEKCAIAKTRVFTGAPIDWSLVVRRYLLSWVKLLQENPILFEACPGTACQSSEWGKLYRHLTQHGSHRMVAGDYSAFDKRMPAAFILGAFQIMENVHRSVGWEEQDLRVIRCIAHDVAFPLTNMNGDLVEFYGTNPSGHPLTVIVNSLVNSLYMRYAYKMLNPERCVTSFKRNVALLTYGDDNIMGVAESCTWFNHTAIQQKLGEIGIVYTMADKSSESRPYIHIDECSFLKRTWRWEPELGDYACPLDMESIHKSLTMWMPSGTLPPEHQLVMVISSANSELFFHGREKFELFRAKFAEILTRSPYAHYVTDSTLPTWDALVERWTRASE